ncbi:MAG: hypothetical protein PVJ04_04180, partial [Gemmatimonadota bacterium]
MRAPGDARKRILLLFFLGIGVPSVLLGYLAFRGIQNDQALVERERQDRHRRIAEVVAGSVDAAIARVEQSLRQQISAPQGAESPSGHPGLDSLRLEEPLIRVVFFLERSGTIRFVGQPLLFSKKAESSSPVSAPDPAQASGALQAARILEIRDQEDSQALAAYRRVYAGASDHRIRAEALNAIARIQARSGSYPEAAEAYRKLQRELGPVRTGNGTPFGVAAQMELGAVLLASGDSVAATRALMGLMDDLLGGEWVLVESQFDFFALRTRETLSELLAGEEVTPYIEASRDSLAILVEEEAAKRATTEVLLAFQETAGDEMLARLASRPDAAETGEEAGGNLRMALDIGGYSHPVSVERPMTGGSTDAPGWWGILFDPERLRNDLLGPVIRQNTGPDPVEWLVKDRTGDTILASQASPRGSPTITATLANGLLPYSLELYQPTPHLVETLLTSRRGVYFYAFLLLTGILVFGLTLTIRSVTDQLELARLKSDFVSTISHEF